MGLTEERRDVFRLLKLASQAVLDGSAQSATPGEKTIYIKAVTVIEMEAALAEAERGRIQLREDVDIWAAVGRAVALWLKEFCDEELPYPQMVREAAVRAAGRLRELEEKNACLLEMQRGQQTDAEAKQREGVYLTPEQVHQVRKALHRAREFSGPYSLGMRDTFDVALSILGWRGGEK